MVSVHDTLNVEGMVAFPTDVGMLIFGANIGIRVPSIAPMTPGNLAILKKLFFVLTMSYGDVGNFTLVSFESSARETLPIIRETVGCEIPWISPHSDWKSPFAK